MAATTSSDSESVLDLDTDDPNALFTSETERTLSATELATRLRFSASLQSIVDDPEFLKSIEYHTLNPIKRAVNPGITVPGIGSRPVAATGILETLKGLFRGTSAKQQQQQSQTQSRYDGDVVPLPLNEATGKDLAGMMKPMMKEDPTSWYLEADEFSLHEFADWKEQLEEVKKEACEKLGLLRYQVVDLVKAVPRYLMLHIGEGEGDEHTLWNDTFASKNSGNGTFAVLRFILPSTRTDGEEEWIVGDDSATENCGDGEDSQFSVYYAAHFSDVSYHTKNLLGVRLELVYLLQYNENFEDTMPLTPTVQQRIIDTMNGWDNRIPWSACTLMHRPQEPQEQAIEVGTLGPADLRKLRLLYRLSKKWRYQCFVANVTITKKMPVAEEGVATTEVSLGRLSNLEGVLLEPPASISTDLLVPITGINDLELKDRTRERAGRTYRYYQYCRVVAFLWPTKFHGRHVEPLAAGDAFLKDWLIERRLNFVDGSKISFVDKVDKAEFSSIALSLCQRGSDMKPFCLDAALRIKDPVLYEAALPGTRTVDLIKRGVDSLGFKAMSPM
ncbi:hypothetical protein EX30DRAFT_264849 [Ascodesmis nigricans]|uniref:Uncharacterized protein n=1 Tax=Ascodesmis nigricans TaxID=341454 RepID=A0A4S2MY26_9PEZI|nr:hypothetical protein EX30DRAFT_264849 [Ascodesmis nigricans]